MVADTATELPTQVMAAAASTAPDRRSDTSPTVRQAWPVEQSQAERTAPDQAHGADFLQLDPASAPPRHLAAWLTAALRDAITDGRLPADARLPATRLLAGQLGVSRGVVVEAYQRLTDEGLLSGRRGGGTTVLATAPTAAPVRSEAAPAGRADRPAPGPARSVRVPAAGLAARGTRRAGLPCTPDADLGYGDPRGTRALRTALATWLARSRGVRADPSGIVVVNGVAQGLALLAQVFAQRGVTTVGYEDPASRGTRDQLERWGLTLAPVPVDDLGPDVDALGDLRAVFVTPAHQYPTGVVLAPPRRRALLDWARSADGRLVIEDDYDAEHRYDRAPVAALAALAPEHVVYLGSVSKTLAPALRLGWVVAPQDVREELVVRTHPGSAARGRPAAGLGRP